MKDFYALTNAGRARRLRRLALEALGLYPFETKRLRLLQNGWNCVFRIDTKDGRKLALRVCLPNMATLEETRSEAMFIAALDRDTDLSPPIPVPMRDGALVAPVTAPGVPEPRHCIAFTWAPGPDLAEALTPRHYGRLGIMMAKMHDFSMGYDVTEGFSCPRFDTIYHPKDPVALLRPENAHLIAAKDRPLFEEAVQRLGEGLERWFSSGPPIVVHHDLHQWNVKVCRGRLTPIDFEDFGWGHPIQDIGTALFYTRRDPARETLWAAFREGYTTVRPWPELKPGDLELVLVRRILDFANHYAGAIDPKYRDRAEARIAGGAEELRRWLGAGC